MSDIETLAKALCASAGDPSERWEEHRARAENVLGEMRELKARIGSQIDEPDPDPVLCDCDEYIDLCVGVSGWRNKDGGWIVEDDYRVAGEVWRVHKSDADPYPSNPHAHCIGGAKRFIGCKLHLGTAQLFKRSEPLGRFLNPKQFDRLIDLIRPKFPDIILPLPID